MKSSAVRRKTVLTVLLMLAVLTQGALQAFADINPDTYSPRTGSYVYLVRSNQTRFTEQGGSFTEAVNGSSNGALIPTDPEYRYMIKNVYDNDEESSKGYTEVLDGTQAQKSSIDAISSHGVATYPETKNSDGSYVHRVNRSHFWWFKMSTESGNPLSGFKKPKVKWTGLYIYDTDTGEHQPVDLYMEVVTHAAGGSFSNDVPALFSVSKFVNGLPSVRIYHVKAVQLRFTAKKAGTDEIYPLKTSITFGDIDGHQSVSSSVFSTNGFSAVSTANLLFGSYGAGENRYFAATGNTGSDIAGDAPDADNYKMAFNIDSGMNENGTFDLVFTSGQSSNNRPSGAFARFYAATYRDPDRAPAEVEIESPRKCVSDSDISDDVDKDISSRSHNALTGMDEEITYTVIQKLPEYMYSRVPETDLDRFVFTDTLDGCLRYVGGSMRVYAVRDDSNVSSGIASDPVSNDMFSQGDVTGKFDISESGGRITAEWKDSNTASDRDSVLYSGGDGTVIKFVFRVKIKDGMSFDDIKGHAGPDGQAHGKASDLADIPNTAEITYSLGDSADPETLLSNTVLTRVKEPYLSILFGKTDKETGEPLEGAAFSLYRGSFPGDEELPEEPLDSWTSAGVFYSCTGKLKKGEAYTLVEDDAPPGYRIADRVVFTAEGSENETVAMEDEPVRSDIVIRKNVTGSLGDKTKRFRFILNVYGTGKNREYQVKKGGSSSSFKTDSDGNGEYRFTLKDDESVTIEGIHLMGEGEEAASFAITEEPNDHKASYSSDSGKNGANSSAGIQLKTGSLHAGIDKEIVFTNERNLSPPTGSGISPGIYCLGFLIILGAVVIRMATA